ncbi:MAG: SpoIIE family protein phosphatase [Oscillospiraceae bacterium]|nr:SpoIIE family protein phosphatase [Oscillospiraceae bacterium]
MEKRIFWRPQGRFGGLRINRPAAVRAASLGAHFGLGLLGGCVRVLGDAGPFGVAMAARAGGGAGGVFCALGAAAGYLLTGGLGWALRYLAALIMVFTASFLLRELRIVRKLGFMSGVSAAVMLLTGALDRYDRLLEPAVLLTLAAEAALTGLGTYFFQQALSTEPVREEQEELRRSAGSLLLLGCALMALSRLTVPGVLSLGRSTAAFCVMAAAFGGGAGSGCFIGLCLGLAMDLGGGSGPFFCLCYAFAGLLSGAMRRQGRLLFLLVYLTANAMAAFWAPERGSALPLLYESFVASVAFLVLPARAMTAVTALVRPPETISGESAVRSYTASRTRELAGAFQELYNTVKESAESTANDTDIATVYDRAAEAVCASCPRKNQCWNQDYVDTLSMLGDATAAMRRTGRLEPGDLPERFREQCSSASGFTAAVNMELRALIYRRQLRAQLEENRSAAYGQYRYLAGVLEAMSEDLRSASGPDALAERRLLRYLNSKDVDGTVSVFRDHSGRLRVVIESARLAFLSREEGYMDAISETLGVRMCRPAGENGTDGTLVLLEAEPLAVSVGVAAVKKEGEPVSGDRGTYFKTDTGVLCVLLSDGMGSGEEAARESIRVVHMLEKFLRSGVEPATAMKILNSVMLLRNGDHWGYATVDLMCIDLFTGETGFYKYGAAPSYIRTGKSVRRVKGVSMAAGVLAGEGEAPDMVRMRLRPGGVALVASDGVVPEENDAWLRDMLTDFEGGDTRELARSVIRKAGALYGYSDDMTVLAVRVEQRA